MCAPYFVNLNNNTFQVKTLLLLADLRAAQACQYLIYSEADFEVFRPAGATRCMDGGEIWHPSSMPNFTPWVQLQLVGV